MFNLKLIKYGNIYREVRTYEKPIIVPLPPEDKGKRGGGGEKALLESMRRTKAAIKGLALSNRWEWFVTFTLSPQKVDRYNYPEVSRKVSQWLDNSRKRACNDMAYLMVPELHKDGAFHFHGLFSNIDGMDLRDSGKKDKKGRTIYNVGRYSLGWTTATRVSDSIAAALYLLKYITKDLCAVTFNRKRYWATKNLDKPDTESDLLTQADREKLEKILQGTCDRSGHATILNGDYSNSVRFYYSSIS